MITQSISDAIAAMNEYDGLHSLIDKNKESNKILDDLSEGINDAIAMMTQLECFKTSSLLFRPSLDHEIFHDLRSFVEKCTRDVQNRQPDRGNVNNFCRTIERYHDRLKGEWRTFVVSLIAEKKIALKSISPFLPDPEACNSIVQFLERLQEKWPVSSSVLNQLSDRLVEADKLISKLNADQKIRDFLALVTNGKATIASVDDTILDWIQKNNIGGNLKISFVK